MEIEIKSRYVKIVEKLNENMSRDSDNANTYDSDGGDIEAYDRFIGGFQLPQAMHIT